MTIRRDMIEAAGRAKALLGDSAGAVERFVRSRQQADGGFAGRGEAGDLYYTVFAVEILAALDAEMPVRRIAAYLDGFGDGQSLDLVHLASLARCRAALDEAAATQPDRKTVGAMAAMVERFRSADGAFSIKAGADAGDVYGCFMATGAMEDLGMGLAGAQAIVARLGALRRADGGYANDDRTAAGSTPATAAAVVLLHGLEAHATRGQDARETQGRDALATENGRGTRDKGRPTKYEIRNTEYVAMAAQWLLARRHVSGGFAAGPGLETLGMTDLLSTATAIHALATVGARLDDLREAALDYLDSLWRPMGGFCGCGADDVVDCEYTFYGLLAMGHLVQ